MIRKPAHRDTEHPPGQIVNPVGLPESSPCDATQAGQKVPEKKKDETLSDYIKRVQDRS